MTSHRYWSGTKKTRLGLFLIRQKNSYRIEINIDNAEYQHNIFSTEIIPIMKLHTPILVIACCFFCSTLARATVLIDETFTTLDAAKWTSTSTSGAFVPAIVSPDKLRLYVNSPNTTQRTFITSTATNIDPFTDPLTVALHDISSYGTAPINTGANMFFAIVGEANSNDTTKYYPAANNFTSAGALALTIQRTATGFGLQVFDYGTSVGSSDIFAMNAMPTSLTWTIDGDAQTWSVSIVGATFNDDAGTSKNGSFVNYTEGSVSRLSLGAINYGGVNGDYNGAGYYVDSLEVYTVPEPSTVAAVIGFGVPFLLLLHQKNRSEKLGKRNGILSAKN